MEGRKKKMPQLIYLQDYNIINNTQKKKNYDYLQLQKANKKK